jgi:hypothetical protein
MSNEESAEARATRERTERDRERHSYFERREAERHAASGRHGRHGHRCPTCRGEYWPGTLSCPECGGSGYVDDDAGEP